MGEGAATCEVNVYTREEAWDYEILPEEVLAPSVLVLGGSSGGVMAVEGTPEELCRFADRVRDAVLRALPEEGYDHSRTKEDARNA